MPGSQSSSGSAAHSPDSGEIVGNNNSNGNNAPLDANLSTTQIYIWTCPRRQKTVTIISPNNDACWRTGI